MRVVYCSPLLQTELLRSLAGFTAATEMFFTTEERNWLRGVTKDFQAYDWKDAFAKEWRRAMLQLWFRHFPHRHPRHFRHSERATERHATPIFGDDWKFMSEVGAVVVS